MGRKRILILRVFQQETDAELRSYQVTSKPRCEFDESPRKNFVLMKVLLLHSIGIQRVQLVEFEWIVVRLAAPGTQTLMLYSAGPQSSSPMR